MSSYTKFELNSLRNNENTMKLQIADIFGCRDKAIVRYDVTKYFAKFEKFIPHSIIIPSFMTVGSQMPELNWEGGGAFLPPHIK